MANLGKWVTAAGGAVVFVFSLVGWIVVVSEKYVSGGTKANCVLQGVLLMLIGAALAAGAVLMYDKLRKGLCGLAGAGAVLALAAVMGLGGMAFWVVVGAVAAMIGANWNCCCQGVCSQADGQGEPEQAATPGPEQATPPESRL